MKELRSEILKKRKNLDPAEKASLDSLICSKLYDIYSSDFSHIENILCYHPTPNEINLLPLYETLQRDGKHLFFPKTYTGHSMDFYMVTDLVNDFVTSHLNIMEPKVFYGNPKYKSRIASAFMLAPGSVFDESCNRMGYGKGFYDAYLGNTTNIVKCAPSYDFQLVEHITTNEWDVPMDIVVTPTRTLYRAVPL